MSEERRNQPDYLSDTPYEAILTELDNAGQPLHVDDLAERLVKRGETVLDPDSYDRDLDRQLISLHHNALPRLAEDGIVAYDRDTNIVTPRTDTASGIDWPDADPFEEALAALGNDEPGDRSAVGLVESREAVIEYGRSLADEAEEELFCLYVTTDLLEEGCLHRAEAAIDRGVEMYVGSRNPDVRDLTRRHLPEATIWEPRRGWLNAPAGYPKVGRLVLVDRRKVMLAVLDAPAADDEPPEETALVGEGADNPVVVLVRELLGPRLDHLDHQSEAFQSELRS